MEAKEIKNINFSILISSGVILSPWVIIILLSKFRTKIIELFLFLI